MCVQARAVAEYMILKIVKKKHFSINFSVGDYHRQFSEIDNLSISAFK